MVGKSENKRSQNDVFIRATGGFRKCEKSEIRTTKKVVSKKNSKTSSSPGLCTVQFVPVQK